jgi:hypothetical protein
MVYNKFTITISCFGMCYSCNALKLVVDVYIEYVYIVFVNNNLDKIVCSEIVCCFSGDVL